MEAEHHQQRQQTSPPQHQHQSPETEFGGSPWVDMGGFGTSSQHQSPLHEYSNYGYHVSPTIVPMEPSYSMSIPPPYTAHQQLQPLIMPQWPSMLTTQSSYSAPPPAAQTVAPISTVTPITCAPLSKAQAAPAVHTPTARRTLTDDDRRRMCQYHEDNPTVKQTEIGALFGVERSTVSKVLRQKDKYLSPEDGNKSPQKKTKGKFPDIERALANWARNHQRQGLLLTDAIIRDKARFFATTVGSNDSHAKVNSASWLEKFKQRNNLMGHKSRKGSLDVVNDSDSALNDSNDQSANQTPNGISPVSPGDTMSPLAMTPSRSHESLKQELPDVDPSTDYIEFGNYRHSHSRSSASIANSVFSDQSGHKVSGGPISPSSPYFSSEHSSGQSPYTPSAQQRLPPLNVNASFRPRRQTFPALGTEQGGLDEPPKTAMHLGLDTSVVEMAEDQSAQINPNLSGNLVLKRNHSTPDIKMASTASMQPPPPKQNPSPISPAGSPTQDDARRALEVVWTFFQNQPNGLVVDPQEYMTIGKLMEKLKLTQSAAAGAGTPLPGGLHPIEEHVGLGLGSQSPRVSKKRSIHSL